MKWYIMGRFGPEDFAGCFIGSRDLELFPAIRDGLDRDRSRTFMDDKGECCQWDDIHEDMIHGCVWESEIP